MDKSFCNTKFKLYYYDHRWWLLFPQYGITTHRTFDMALREFQACLRKNDE